jgi:hypothetical protein
MHPMRVTMLLLEQNLGRAVFWKAAAQLRNNIDWSGGDGESIYLEVRNDYPQLPREYEDGVDTSRFKSLLRAWTIHEVEYTFDELRRLFQGDMITVWRMITAPRDWKVEQQHPGLHWSWEKHAAEAHWGDFSDGHVSWLIAGKIAFRDVDWVETLAANAHPDFKDEKEIKLIAGRPVEIIGTQQV